MDTEELNARLIRIEEQTAHASKSMEGLQVRLETRWAMIESHDREIALLKQAQESERKYLELKNDSFESRLNEQSRLWADNDSEHASMLQGLQAIKNTLTAYQGGGKVIYWLVGAGAGVLASMLVSYLTR